MHRRRTAAPVPPAGSRFSRRGQSGARFIHGLAGQRAFEEEEERGGKRLAPDVEQRRQELLALTRGKRCLFVGGHVREEHRQRIQEALELEALEWPETDRFDTNPNEFAAEVRRSD